MMYRLDAKERQAIGEFRVDLYFEFFARGRSSLMAATMRLRQLTDGQSFRRDNLRMFVGGSPL
jgi:hypothetical protein